MKATNERLAGVPGFADRACDTAVLGFALWTICAHAAVLAGLGLHALMALAAAVWLAAASLAWWRRGDKPWWRRGRATADTDARGAAVSREDGGEPSEPRSAPPAWSRLAVGAGAAACVVAAAMSVPLTTVWLAATSIVVVVAASEALRGGGGGTARPTNSKAATWVLLVMALGCAIATLSAHRPDIDDGFYVNLAVAAVDAPDAAVLAGDTLHRVADVPLALPVYRVHSIELLEAAIARLTGRPVLDIAHLWLPTAAALLVPFVVGRALRILLPRAWVFGVAIALAWTLTTATASHGWANFGLVRLHQGKGLLLTLALPLILAYALEFARRGGTRAWLRLAAAQIGALGLSASGLWLAPAIAGAALIAGLPSLASSASRRRLMTGIAASSYVVVVALAARAATAAAFRDAAVPGPATDFTSLQLTAQAFRAVFGFGVGGAAALFCTVAAWSFAADQVTRRFCAYTALIALVLCNPFFADWIAAQVTSAPVYWRVLWLLPMPLFAAVVLTAPIRWWPGAGGRAVCVVAAIATFGASIALAPRAFVLSSENQVRLGTPGWKVPPSDFDAARAIASAAGPESLVLAPKRVAPWIPTLHDYPAPLVVRIEYIPVLHEKLGGAEIERRVNLMNLVSGAKRPPRAEALLRDAIRDERLAVVCLAQAALRWDDLVEVLREAGFQKIHRNADYVVWARGGTDLEPGTSNR